MLSNATNQPKSTVERIHEICLYFLSKCLICFVFAVELLLHDIGWNVLFWRILQKSTIFWKLLFNLAYQ